MVRRRQSRSVGAVALIAVVNSGCGVLFQTALGWKEERTEVERVPHRVRVEAPEGAEVARVDEDGKREVLGTGPVVDELSYQKVTVYDEPKTLGLVIGGLLSAGAGVGLVVAAKNAGGDDCPPEDICFDTEGTAKTTGYVMGATVAILGALTDLTIAWIYGATGSHLSGSRVQGRTHYTYRATLGGQVAEESVDIPHRYAITLSPSSSPEAPTLVAAPVPPPPAAPVPSSVIAVMDVEDVNADTDKALENSLVRNLGDQLRIFIAQTGARTIDRSAQVTALREQVAQMKGESYQACYDDACQIELGKALAASHILRSRVTRFGSRCVLNAELVDLRSEVTVKAASSRGGCEAEGFLTMAEQVAQKVVE